MRRFAKLIGPCGLLALWLSSAVAGAVAQEDGRKFEEVRAAWLAHYQPLLQPGMLRPQNEPRIFDHGRRSAHAIVLLHGLTDGPAFFDEVGRVFFHLGFNVVIPLLPGHGLQDPERINSVTYQQWLNEAEFAVQLAQTMGDTVSIGGLSTGGALAVNIALSQPQKIKGALFLFSTALSIGALPEQIVRFEICDRMATAAMKIYRRYTLDETVDGIGLNPFRYSHMFYLPARQLVLLNDAIRSRYPDREHRYGDITQPVFIAHSEADATASIGEIEKVAVNHKDAANQVSFFRLSERYAVPHASVVLGHDVTIAKDGGPLVLEKKNPLFDDMIVAVRRFVAAHLGT